jgi:glycosyltransferase involved in cell wall biosynthesis
MIQILLATYNGEDYLEEQLDSLFHQTYTNWTLLVHDDGSTDSTLKILSTFQKRYPDVISILTDGLRFGNARDNFTHLVSASTSNYVMFCDQDDIWLPQKIKKTFNEMDRLVRLHGDLPIAVHTDLEVVDGELNSIASSMFQYQGLSKSIDSLLQILLKNSVTGCTMMINRKAINVSMPILPPAIMHDWWIVANVIKHHGMVEFIDESLIQYRQHGANSVGAKENSIFNFIVRCFSYAFHQDTRDKVYNQAKSISPNLNTFHFFKEKIKLSIKSFFI